MNEISELIKAVSSLLWPVFAFVVLFIFKEKIGDVIGRFKKGKLLGQELELNDSLESLHNSASKLSEEVSSIPLQENIDLSDDAKEKINIEDDSIKSIIHESSRSPKAALILLATDIEKESKMILASIGKLQNRKHVFIKQAISELDSHYGLPKHIASSLNLFWDTRNKIIHGGEASDENILSAIDSGVTILNSLRALPKETNWVHHPGVNIYSDPECKVEINGTKGVILKSSSSSGANIFYRIFPTTKSHFTKGKIGESLYSIKNSAVHGRISLRSATTLLCLGRPRHSLCSLSDD